MSTTPVQIPTMVPMTVLSSNQTVDSMSVASTSQKVGMTTSLSFAVGGVKDYEKLINKPSINGVELVGDKTADELNLAYKIKSDTVDGWAHNIDYVPLKDEIIIYTNYAVKDGKNIPAIKIGDGMAYVIDLPFVGDDLRDEYLAHIRDTTMHVSADDRTFWNNKVRCYLNGDTIVFTTR